MIGVIGNEAADADSIVCAIAYAQIRNGAPFVTIPISDLNSRLDFMAICHIVEIENPQGKFRIRSTQDPFGDVTGWILVDHNSNQLVSPICEIIDHHQIGRNTADLSLIPHTIETVGSCSTLVAEKLLEKVDFCQSDVGKLVLQMLLLTIILDTLNFSKACGKTTEKDIEISTRISGILAIDSSIFSAWFDGMRAAKFDARFWYAVENSEKILSYDFKEFETARHEIIGISTILREIDDGVIDSVLRAKNHRRLFVVGAGYMKEGSLKTDLLIVGNLGDQIVSHLVENFKLEPYAPRSHRQGVLLFKVNDATFSRKRFAPVLIRLLDSE